MTTSVHSLPVDEVSSEHAKALVPLRTLIGALKKGNMVVAWNDTVCLMKDGQERWNAYTLPIPIGEDARLDDQKHLWWTAEDGNIAILDLSSSHLICARSAADYLRLVHTEGAKAYFLRLDAPIVDVQSLDNGSIISLHSITLPLDAPVADLAFYPGKQGIFAVCNTLREDYDLSALYHIADDGKAERIPLPAQGALKLDPPFFILRDNENPVFYYTTDPQGRWLTYELEPIWNKVLRAFKLPRGTNRDCRIWLSTPYVAGVFEHSLVLAPRLQNRSLDFKASVIACLDAKSHKANVSIPFSGHIERAFCVGKHVILVNGSSCPIPRMNVAPLGQDVLIYDLVERRFYTKYEKDLIVVLDALHKSAALSTYEQRTFPIPHKSASISSPDRAEITIKLTQHALSPPLQSLLVSPNGTIVVKNSKDEVLVLSNGKWSAVSPLGIPSIFKYATLYFDEQDRLWGVGKMATGKGYRLFVIDLVTREGMVWSMNNRIVSIGVCNNIIAAIEVEPHDISKIHFVEYLYDDRYLQKQNDILLMGRFDPYGLPRVVPVDDGWLVGHAHDTASLRNSTWVIYHTRSGSDRLVAVSKGESPLEIGGVMPRLHFMYLESVEGRLRLNYTADPRFGWTSLYLAETGEKCSQGTCSSQAYSTLGLAMYLNELFVVIHRYADGESRSDFLQLSPVSGCCERIATFKGRVHLLQGESDLVLINALSYLVSAESEEAGRLTDITLSSSGFIYYSPSLRRFSTLPFAPRSFIQSLVWSVSQTRRPLSMSE